MCYFVLTGPLSTVSAVAGGAVLLPCDVTPPTATDAAILVLIFKGDTGTPIYRLAICERVFDMLFISLHECMLLVICNGPYMHQTTRMI